MKITEMLRMLPYDQFAFTHVAADLLDQAFHDVESDHLASRISQSFIFVFGSNLDGRHGSGAARDARNYFGAELGVGEGLTGTSYALPTVGHNMANMTLEEIKPHVDTFLQFAASKPQMHFLLTAVGTGLAGHTHEDIAPMFNGYPKNVTIPKEWWGLCSPA